MKKFVFVLIISFLFVGYARAGFDDFISVDIPNYNSDDRSVEHVKIKDDERLKLINIAYQIGGLDFMSMLDAENDRREWNRQSEVIRKDGTREKSFGLCQLNLPSSKFYTQFYNSEYFKDPEKQLLFCYNEYKKALDGGYIKTKFYGRNVKERNKKRFEIGNKNNNSEVYLLSNKPTNAKTGNRQRNADQGFGPFSGSIITAIKKSGKINYGNTGRLITGDGVKKENHNTGKSYRGKKKLYTCTSERVCKCSNRVCKRIIATFGYSKTNYIE